MKPNIQNTDNNDPPLIVNHWDIPNSARLVDTRDDVAESQRTRILSKQQIIDLWRDTGLDLLVITPADSAAARLAVIKLVDYGKHKYEQTKHQKEQARKQRENARTLKEYQFNPGISDHDYGTKLAHITEALDRHDIRIFVKFNRKARQALGRSYNPHQVARDPEFVLNRVIADLGALIAPVARINVSDSSFSANLRGSLVVVKIETVDG